MHLVLTAHDPCWVVLRGASASLVATVKAGVRPRNRRRFNEDLNCWEVHWHWLPQVVSWARRDHGSVDYADLPTHWQMRAAGAHVGDVASSYLAGTVSVPSPYAVLCVTEEAPQEVITAAYRALVRIHHPDVGGDAAHFQKIVAAYREISPERKSYSQSVDNPVDNSDSV